MFDVFMLNKGRMLRLSVYAAIGTGIAAGATIYRTVDNEDQMRRTLRIRKASAALALSEPDLSSSANADHPADHCHSRASAGVVRYPPHSRCLQARRSTIRSDFRGHKLPYDRIRIQSLQGGRARRLSTPPASFVLGPPRPIRVVSFLARTLWAVGKLILHSIAYMTLLSVSLPKWYPSPSIESILPDPEAGSDSTDDLVHPSEPEAQAEVESPIQDDKSHAVVPRTPRKAPPPYKATKVDELQQVKK